MRGERGGQLPLDKIWKGNALLNIWCKLNISLKSILAFDINKIVTQLIILLD